MKREIIDQLCNDFERLVHVEQDKDVEFWLARSANDAGVGHLAEF